MVHASLRESSRIFHISSIDLWQASPYNKMRENQEICSYYRYETGKKLTRMEMRKNG
jgi:hypothetical protein